MFRSDNRCVFNAPQYPPYLCKLHTPPVKSAQDARAELALRFADSQTYVSASCMVLVRVVQNLYEGTSRGPLRQFVYDTP
jgi:hypothetical protein